LSARIFPLHSRSKRRITHPRSPEHIMCLFRSFRFFQRSIPYCWCGPYLPLPNALHASLLHVRSQCSPDPDTPQAPLRGPSGEGLLLAALFFWSPFWGLYRSLRRWPHFFLTSLPLRVLDPHDLVNVFTTQNLALLPSPSRGSGVSQPSPYTIAFLLR